MATTRYEKLFAEATDRLGHGYKTGHFCSFRNEKQQELAVEHGCDCLGAGLVEIDWYLTRTAKREPVIRVKYWFPTEATRKVYKSYGGRVLYSYKKTWDVTERSEKFPFTLDGLKAAFKYAESL